MINVGDKIPEATLHVMGEKGTEAKSSLELFGKGKVVLFAVPGAFTPTCSQAHLPGYVVHADAIKAKGVSTIACMAVNDAFVMHAWGKASNADARHVAERASVLAEIGKRIAASGTRAE